MVEIGHSVAGVPRVHERETIAIEIFVVEGLLALSQFRYAAAFACFQLGHVRLHGGFRDALLFLPASPIQLLERIFKVAHLSWQEVRWLTGLDERESVFESAFELHRGLLGSDLDLVQHESLFLFVHLGVINLLMRSGRRKRQLEM